jgi:hypothetical protein
MTVEKMAELRLECLQMTRQADFKTWIEQAAKLYDFIMDNNSSSVQN